LHQILVAPRNKFWFFQSNCAASNCTSSM
jgi:hypothetical protein